MRQHDINFFYIIVIKIYIYTHIYTEHNTNLLSHDIYTHGQILLSLILSDLTNIT